MEKCTKEKEIDRITKVLYDNGEKGLITKISNLNQSVNLIDENVKQIQSNVNVLLQFQNQVEIQAKETDKKKIEIAALKRGDSINKRWFIGLAISTIMGLLAIIVTLIYVDFNNKEKDAVSEQEFKELWNDYEKDHITRGFKDEGICSGIFVTNYD